MPRPGCASRVRDEEDVLLRVVIVGREVLLPVRLERVVPGVDHGVGRGDRVLPPRRTLREAGRGDGARVDLRVQVQAGQNRVGRALRDAAMPARRAASPAAPCALAFSSDSMKRNSESRATRGVRLDLRAGDERHAAEQVHQHVVVPRAQRAQLGERLRLAVGPPAFVITSIIRFARATPLNRSFHAPLMSASAEPLFGVQSACRSRATGRCRTSPGRASGR